MKTIALFFFTLLSGVSLSQSSTLFIQSELFFIDENTELHIFGDMVTNGVNDTLINRGFIQTYSAQNPGNFELRNLGNVLSTGGYKIANDWINNGRLVIDTGTVEMYGDNQFFQGDSISSFWNLLLTGTNKKEQDQDIRIRNILNLTDLELSVHDQLLYIDNSEVDAIQYDNTTTNAEGIISTDEDGIIRKIVNENETNIIPTGSSLGVFRHRPVKSTLTGASFRDTVFVTFHNHSPDLVNAPSSSFVDTMCRIQDNYFYTINAADNSNIYNFDFAFSQIYDGYYPIVAEWNHITSIWQLANNGQFYSDGAYYYASAIGETNFFHEHYSFGTIALPAPELYVDPACYDMTSAEVISPLDQPAYNWTVTNSDNSAFYFRRTRNDFHNNRLEWKYWRFTDSALHRYKRLSIKRCYRNH